MYRVIDDKSWEVKLDAEQRRKIKKIWTMLEERQMIVLWRLVNGAGKMRYDVSALHDAEEFIKSKRIAWRIVPQQLISIDQQAKQEYKREFSSLSIDEAKAKLSEYRLTEVCFRNRDDIRLWLGRLRWGSLPSLRVIGCRKSARKHDKIRLTFIDDRLAVSILRRIEESRVEAHEQIERAQVA